MDGIYNTMTMAVTERAPDIGIMKAIGANPKTIKQIFLLESSYIGIVGALIGTIVAYLVSFLVNLGLPLIIEFAFQEELPEQLQFSMIPVSLVLISVGICLLVTILSGLRPAKRATQIDDHGVYFDERTKLMIQTFCDSNGNFTTFYPIASY